MIKAVIFDFDGVLFDSQALHFDAMNQVMTEFGLKPVSHEAYAAHYVGLTDPAIFTHALTEQGHAATPEALRQIIHQKVALYRKNVHTYPSLPAIQGVENFLQAMSEYVNKFAICSNGSHAEVQAVLSRLEGGSLLPYFSFVTTVDDVNRGKPDPEGYLLTAKKLAIEPSQCLIIEDSFGGLRAARAAGAKVIGLTTSHSREALFPYADHVVETYADLLTWLLPKLKT